MILWGRKLHSPTPINQNHVEEKAAIFNAAKKSKRDRVVNFLMALMSAGLKYKNEYYLIDLDGEGLVLIHYLELQQLMRKKCYSQPNVLLLLFVNFVNSAHSIETKNKEWVLFGEKCTICTCFYHVRCEIPGQGLSPLLSQYITYFLLFLSDNPQICVCI